MKSARLVMKLKIVPRSLVEFPRMEENSGKNAARLRLDKAEETSVNTKMME
jgi:hypothetical protein